MSRVVPVQSDVNANKPFFAPLGSGGGGTGGAGPNLLVSTISFPVSNQTTEGCVNYTGNLSFNDSTTAVKNTIGFHNGNNYPGMPADVTAIQLAAPVGNQAVTVIGAADDGSSYISATNTGSTPAPLVLSGASVNMSNLIVSSINGAIPYEGSANPNPIVSSLTLGFPGGGPPAPLLVQHNSSTDPGNYTAIQADVLNYSASINNRIDPVVYVSTGATRVPGNFGAGLLILGDTASTQGYFTDNPYLTNSNSTLQLVATTDVVIPNNLVVSSINGAAPGGSPNPNPVFSSITTGSLSTVSLLADNMNISSITVSSINGAPPGGGVLSANPSFSSITLAVGGGGNGAINISTSMFINGLGGGSNSSYVFQPNFGILGSVRNVLTFRAPNTSNTQMLISQGDDATSRIDCTDAGVNTGSLGIFALTTISTLNVSTINGTAVVGASDMSTLQGQMAEVRSTLGFV